MANVELSKDDEKKPERWSYSKVTAFSECPYKWYLTYIHKVDKEKTFFAEYGTLMHHILEEYLSGRMDKKDAVIHYLVNYPRGLKDVPSAKIAATYYNEGLSYLRGIEPFQLETLCVEKRGEFSVGGENSVAILDCVAKSDEGLCIIDHKSRKLKPRSGRANPTKSDMELDKYLRQLYLYSWYVKQEFGEVPKHLIFNCFRNNSLIKERFDAVKMEETKRWYLDSIETIQKATDFPPNMDWFYCNYLCDCKGQCEYFEVCGR